MLREEVKAMCDVMGANLQIKPEPIRGYMKHCLNWGASITHPEVPFCYVTRGARSNHQAASEVLWLFLREFEKDKRVHKTMWVLPSLREMLDGLPKSKRGTR